MALFKNKKKLSGSILDVLLNDKRQKAQEEGKNYFYQILFDNEIEKATKWCERHGAHMEVDHKTDNNIFYKFIF